MLKNKILRKVLAVSLASVMLCGTGFTTVGQFVGTGGVTVSATDTLTYGKFQYKVKDENTVTITKYKGYGGDVVIPDMIDGKSVTRIGSNAFEYCEGLKSITIPDSVTTIGKSAFSSCINLKSITIPDSVISIDGSAFCYCRNLTSVTLSKNMTTIPSSIFTECLNLENITIPEGVTVIGTGAFSRCTKLKNINIPDSATKIKDSAFSGCSALESLTFSDNITELAVNCIGGCSGLTDLTLKCKFGDNSSYYDYVLATLTNLTNLTVGTGKQKVSLSWQWDVSLPKLKTVTLGDNAVLSTVFPKCENIENFYVSENNPNYSAEDGILFNKDKTTLYRYPSARKGTFTIPENVNALFSDAFSNCQYLTEINIPESVANLGDHNEYNYEYYDYYYYYNQVFSNCISLKSINVSENNPNYSSKDGILFNKDKTSIIRFPTTKRGSYTVPKNVTYLACGSFNKTKLSDITIHNDVNIYYDPGEAYNGMEDGYNDHVFSDNSGLIIRAEEYSPAHTYSRRCKVPIEFLFTNKSNISASRIVLGQTVTVNANADYGDGNYTYAVYYKQSSGKKWTVKQDYDTNSSVQIKPSYATDYDICVKAKDGTGNISQQYFAVKVLDKLKNTSSISTDTIFKGDNVYVYPGSTGGFSEYDSFNYYEYSVLYKNVSSKKWTVQNEYEYLSRHYYDNTKIITPANAGDYEICVKIKDEAGTVAKKYFTVHVKNPEPLTNESTVSASNIIIGDKLTVNCQAKGGKEYYQYQVLYKQTSQAKWTTAQAFAENTAVTFKPAKATSYDVCVKVKDSSGTIVKKNFTVQVNAKLTNTSTISSATVKKGDTVTVNGSATGGAGDYTYAVYYKQKAQSKWTTQQDFGVNDTISVKPAKATDYDICVKVKDTNGTIVKKYFTVNVTE